MPKPRSPKETKQFLGLTGYYRNLIPRFSDISRPLMNLLAHDCEFNWNIHCDISFQMLKDALCSAPILKYCDTSKLYTLYKDAAEYSWAGVLTQTHMSIIDGKEITMDHPVLYVSGLFCGSQLNWATLIKEAYAIYMSVKKSNILSYRSWNYPEELSPTHQEVPEKNGSQWYSQQLIYWNWEF